jgi:hypothetical protein
VRRLVICLVGVWEASVVKDRLGYSSAESHHCKTAVLDFLVLELVDLFLALAVKKGSSEAEVTGVSARSLQHFCDSDPGDNFESADKDESISHNTIRNKSVVGGGRSESLT